MAGFIVLIAASMAGDQDTIDEYLPIIKQYAAKHGDDPLYVTRRWVQSQLIIEALEAELRAVGILYPKLEQEQDKDINICSDL